MGYLDTYTGVLDQRLAAHLLRRATFGPTSQEIVDFTGKNASSAVEVLMSNVSYRLDPPPPIEMDSSRSDAGQQFLDKPYSDSRPTTYNNYIQYWWIGLMTEQKGRPSFLEKLTAFWQNHFVVRNSVAVDYRYIYQYLRLLRANALGSFRDMAIGVTKDPAMLVFQDGYENTKLHPNENYGRELQELFTVGQKDFAGNYNYSEQDVKTAARVLTGWQVTNKNKVGSTSFGAVFTPERHDTQDKTFSEKYGNKVISGRSGPSAGDDEILDLINMLLAHPETPKFICRKLYRWYVNPNVTQEIEDAVIAPLANFFSSPENNFQIGPLIRKIFTSQIFYDERNIGAIVKSPAEFMIGSMRHFNQPVPDLTTDYDAFRKMMSFLSTSMNVLQLNFLNQPSVFGSLPFYQTGYSKNWINGTTLGLRGERTDMLVFPSFTVKPGYMLGIDILGSLTALQPNFSDVLGTPPISCETVLAAFSKNLFAVPLSDTQKNFLIDSIMMMNSSARTTWEREWNAYRQAPSDMSKQNTILWRCRALYKYMLRMAEFQVF
ncbi:DUF1800 domain-containing protein [Dyadobacter sp.]|uniref:DUF1800 domain-containing protein n=1 Tax=Dyadobacter sp. TaxID=1914288 RepID=UPI003F6F5B02